MIIGIVADPLNHPDWPKLKAWLEPAAKRGNLPCYEPGWAIWAVYDEGEPIAALAARLCADQTGEVTLVGGKDFRRWFHLADERIGQWFKACGRTSMCAFGRRGWDRVFSDQWKCLGNDGKYWAYERPL